MVPIHTHSYLAQGHQQEVEVKEELELLVQHDREKRQERIFLIADHVARVLDFGRQWVTQAHRSRRGVPVPRDALRVMATLSDRRDLLSAMSPLLDLNAAHTFQHREKALLQPLASVWQHRAKMLPVGALLGMYSAAS